MLHFEGVGSAFPVSVCVGDGKSMIRDRMFIREWLRIIQDDPRLAVAIESVTRNPKPENRNPKPETRNPKPVFSSKPLPPLDGVRGFRVQGLGVL